MKGKCRRVHWLSVVPMVALLCAMSPVPARASEPQDGEVLRITFATQAQLARLAARLDIWEVHREAGYLVAYVTPANRAWLEAEGFAVQALPAPFAHLTAIPGYPCYRSVEELYVQLAQWALHYPVLVDLMTIGESYEGRPLMVAHLTNRAITVDKPVFFLMANIHGRELITNEVAMVFIQSLLENYGVDPDAKWLLDYHDLYVLVSANPDGHVKNEAGEPWSWWRKNTNPSYDDCEGIHYGVDLNRNASFEWGGSSTDPCADTYQGPSPASEVETQVFEAFMRAIFMDQRGSEADDPAPDDATGLFISLHSYGNMVLWPWAHTYAGAPNKAQLQQLGLKLTAFNGYLSQQAYALYPVTGSVDGVAYGELGIAAYTFEIGSQADGFYPPCSRYDALVQPNLGALRYAAKVAAAPYRMPFGPDATGVTATLNEQQLQVQATLDDSENGGQVIVAAEAYIDVLPAYAEIPYALEAIDGQFDTSVEIAEGTLAVDSLLPGRHLVFVRGRDANSAWGPVTASFFVIPPLTYGGHISPLAAERSGAPGSSLLHMLFITNTANTSDIYTLTATARHWTVTIAPAWLVLPQDASALATVTVTIPALGESLLLLAPELVTATLISGGDPSVMVKATFTVSAYQNAVFLPLILRE